MPNTNLKKTEKLTKFGIIANFVAPGFMETATTSGLQDKKLDSNKWRAPLSLPDTEHIASIVLQLSEERSEKITEVTFTVDGGSAA